MEDKEIKYISLSKAAKMTEYSQEYISLLCRTKKMKGVKLGRNWVTTVDWVREYIDRTNGKSEFVVPVRIENKKKEPAPQKPGFIVYKPHYLSFSEVTVFTIFFGIMLAAFVYFQEMLLLRVLT
ncbi:MAG: hypothetical protein WC788_00975 [Candidatus Paceibacterota bacterium]|jgi:hypothetical protein